MPIIKQINKDDCVIALWNVQESVEQLTSMLNLNNDERETLAAFKLTKRKLEWLGTRALLKVILDEDVKITYNKKGKPSLLNSHYKISITHSGNYIAIIISEKYDVGVDIEKVTDTFFKIKHKFMNLDELARMPKTESSKYMCAHWCAKETLIKITGEKHFDYKSQFPLEIENINSKGAFKGKIIEGQKQTDFIFQYISISNYLLVWTYSNDKN